MKRMADTVDQSLVRITDEIHVVEARYCGRLAAADVGLQELATHRLLTILSELATNLVFHSTKGGTILVDVVRGVSCGVRVTAQDQGPGIDDVALALSDGYSTAGGLGYGLGGVQRLADEFVIRSSPTGTVIEASVWAR